MYVFLIAVGLCLFAVCAVIWYLLTFICPQYKRLAVPTAAVLAFIATLILIFNAMIHPDRIKVPEVNIPTINVPSHNIP